MDLNDLHLRDYLMMIYKRRLLVAVFFVVFVAASMIVTVSQTPVYTASTKMIIEKSDPSVLPSQLTLYMTYDPEFYETQYQLIKSVAVAERVIDALGLDVSSERFLGGEPGPFTLAGLKKRIMNVFGRGEGSGPAQAVRSEAGDAAARARRESLAKTISGGIFVSPVKDSRIVLVSYNSSDPDLAMRVANSVAQAYIEQILEMRMTNTRYTIEWMAKKADEERKRLADMEAEFQAYVKANDIVTLENRIAIVPQKLSEYGAQLIRAETEKNELKALYEKIAGFDDLRDAEALGPIAENDVLASLRAQAVEADRKIGEMERVYGRKHPALIRAIEERDAIETKRMRELERSVAAIKSQYDFARNRTGSIQGLVEQTKGEVLALNEKFVQYEVMRKNLDASRQLYDALIQKMKEQSFTENIRTVNVWIIEPAQRPGGPTAPNVPQSAIFAVLVGLLGGIGLAFVIEQLDTTVKSVEEAEAKLGVPMLGLVPFMREAEMPIEGIVGKEPRSAFTESYKNIRTSLLLSSAETPPRTVLVTSMEPKEGKTATSINLASAIAQSHMSVLLVDADLRKPNIHRVLGLGNEQGLSSFLAGASALNIVRVESGETRGIDVLASGPIPPNPSELLGSHRMREFMEEVKAKYDMIVIDSSPLLSLSDALVVSRVVDGTILIARADKTTYNVLRKGIKSLSDVRAHLLGVVINAVDVSKHKYYYYNYNYKYYSSDTEEP